MDSTNRSSHHEMQSKQTISEDEAQRQATVFRRIVINAVQDRYPYLAEMARAKAESMQDPDLLFELFESIIHAPNADAARSSIENAAS